MSSERANIGDWPPALWQLPQRLLGRRDVDPQVGLERLDIGSCRAGPAVGGALARVALQIRVLRGRGAAAGTGAEQQCRHGDEQQRCGTVSSRLSRRVSPYWPMQ